MSKPLNKESQRMLRALRATLDGRDIVKQNSEIMVTLEGVVSATLLMLLGNDHRAASIMLNEGLLQGVERRLAMAANKKQKGAGE